MFKPRPCGCKGIRTCLVCEDQFGIDKHRTEPNKEALLEALEFCHLCGDIAWPGCNVWRDHPNHQQEHNGGNKVEVLEGALISDGRYPFPGVYLQPDFLSEAEEQEMVDGCDGLEWTLSQSGRRKQNFGPKTNFKKKKIAGKSFQGFPSFSQKFQEKLTKVPILQNFLTIEQCAIEYRPETGACIDPHIDDCWVWGEHVISVSLLSDSVLTMNKYLGNNQKYNLEYHQNNSSKETSIISPPVFPNSDNTSSIFPIVRIPMPRRSLLILYGPARYSWEHSVLRKDITSRRICMAYREFTPEYLPNGNNYEIIGQEIIDKAYQFF